MSPALSTFTPVVTVDRWQMLKRNPVTLCAISVYNEVRENQARMRGVVSAAVCAYGRSPAALAATIINGAMNGAYCLRIITIVMTFR